MTTGADELRAAARVLRALLADRELTPGPWLSMDRGDRLLWNGEGAEDRAPVYVVDEPMSNGANADYIAAMHPDVGHALADWLDEEADRRDAHRAAAIQIWGSAEHPDAVAWLTTGLGKGSTPALSLARQINTGSQP